MRTIITALGVLCASLTFAQDAPESTDDGSDLIVTCEITGMIDEGIRVVVERTIQEAKDLDADLIIFRVDTPGGRVDSAVSIASTIDTAHCPTVSYIEGMGAISAGALISFACDDLVMTKGTNIGAAAPVMMTAEGTEALGEKETSYVRAKMRALAEANGHNPAIAEAMVDKDIELRGIVDDDGNYSVVAVNPGTQSEDDDSGSVESTGAGELVLAKGKLLTLTPNEALKYGVISAIVEDFDEAASLFGEADSYREHLVVANWAERTFRFLTNPTIAGLLLMLALGGLYFEVRTPGFGVPGMVGITALCLLFGAHYILGLTEVIDLLLILAGISLIALEAFVIPGFGAAGVAGFLCLVVGTYLSFTNFTIPEYSWQFDRVEDVAWSMIIASISFAVVVITTWRFLPRTPLYKKIMLGASQEVDAGFTTQTAEEAASAIGLEGTTTSMLRPAGKGRFEGQLYDIVSRGDFIETGAAVRIIQADGNRYVVKPITDQEESA